MAADNPFKVKIVPDEVPEADVRKVMIDFQLDQPDMIELELDNKPKSGGAWGDKLGPGLEIEIEVEGKKFVTGEIVALEPSYDGASASKLVVRAFSRMHRLTRGRKSRTFEKQTAKQVAQKIIQDAKLTPECEDPSPATEYPHLYQHNENDLNFLRLLAARVGFALWGEEKKIFFKKRDVSQSPVLKLELNTNEPDDEKTGLKKFRVRCSDAQQVTKVIVRGWDPKEKKVIEGVAENPSSSRMGDNPFPSIWPMGSPGSEMPDVVTYDVDYPVASKEEAEALAKAELLERQLNYIVGDGTCIGHQKLKPGVMVEIKLKEGDPYAGKYYVTRATHSYAHGQESAGAGSGGGSDSKGGGYQTNIRVRRDATSEGNPPSDAQELG